ncbi:metal-dependent hydrolase [bacterium]|nr:metal-dependent hydrolase [bacterium]
MEILYLGHSAFAVRLDSGRRLAIDPFLTDNPRAAAKPDDLLDCDLVLVTHDHDDHLGDAFDMCTRSGATLVAIFELAMEAQAQGITVEPMSIGGSIDLDGLVVNMVHAQHGAGRGHAAGFVLEAERRNLYFAGDTALFGDMKLFGDLWDLDVAVLPVGDRFTMGPRHAARAVDMLGADHVIPCHYATWPLLRPDASEFEALASERAAVHVLSPGEKLDL